MIENKTFTGTALSAMLSRVECAKNIAYYLTDKIQEAEILAEYVDGIVLKINGFKNYVSLSSDDYVRIYISIQSQNNDTLSDNTKNAYIVEDFTKITDTTVYAPDIQSGSEYITTVSLSTIINGKSLILIGSSPNLQFLQDEDDNNYIGVSIGKLYDSDGVQCTSSSVLNTSTSFKRDNSDEIVLVSTFLVKGSVYNKKLKKVYSTFMNSNIQSGSRYRFDGEEYYAISTTQLFRLEGGN